MDAVTTTAQQYDSGDVVVENGVARLTASDARVWSVQTEEGQVTAGIDQFTTNSGPFPPGSYQEVATNLITNNGDVSGAVNAEFARVDNQGNVLTQLCSTSVTLDVGQTAGVLVDPNAGSSCTTQGTAGGLNDTLPDQFNATVNYGFRVWGADENQPPYPTPSGQVSGQQQQPDFLDDTINDIANQLGVEPEIVVATGVATGGLVGGYLIEENFNVIR